MKNKKEKPIGFHAQIGHEMLHRFDYLQLRDEYANKNNVHLPHIYYEEDERPLTKRYVLYSDLSHIQISFSNPLILSVKTR